MKKNIVLFILIIVFSGCSKGKNYHIEYLNGYWEIEKVILADGTEKIYNYNQSIDFFEVKDSTGVRKKVQPQLDGSFITTKDGETLTLKIENDSLRAYYKTPMAAWKETILTNEFNKMSIKNDLGNIYFYKRYQKMDLQ